MDRWECLSIDKKTKELQAIELAYDIDWTGLEEEYRYMGWSEIQIEDEKKQFFYKCTRMMMENFCYLPSLDFRIHFNNWR